MSQNSKKRWGSLRAIPYEPKSPSPESIFARNQRRIKEYEIAREQEDIRAHYRRQIDEVIEKKRRVLREAIYPEPNPGPRPVPLDPALKVTVAYHPGELQFSLMAEPSSSQPRREMFEAEFYQSSVTTSDQITDILAIHGLSSLDTLKCRAPTRHERSCFAPGGRDSSVKYAAWSQEHLKAGALLPLKSFFRDFTDFVGLAPFQLNTNSYRVLSALRSLFHELGWIGPSPQEILYLFCLKSNPSRARGGDGFYYLSSYPKETKIFEDLPNHPPDFKKAFFWTDGLFPSRHRSFRRIRKYSRYFYF